MENSPRPIDRAVPATRFAAARLGVPPPIRLTDSLRPGGAHRSHGRHRRVARAVLGAVAGASAAGLTAGLLTWTPSDSAAPRPLTAQEAQRLAAVRVTNLRDVRSGVRLTVGDAAARTDLLGWIDWSRQLAYLDVGGPGAGPNRGLVQATPALLLARPDPAALPAPAPPPLVPPTDGWRVRDASAAHALRPVLDLLFALAATRPEPARVSAGGGRWLAHAEVGGQPVDVFQAPLPVADRRDVPTSTSAGSAGADERSEAPKRRSGEPSVDTSPPWPGPVASLPATAAPPPARALEGPARWWVDRDARLYRLQGRLPGGAPVILELQRSNRPTLWPVAALGGRPGLPRTPNDAEAERLARLPARLRAGRGASVSLTAPVAPGVTLRGTGWVSWTTRAAYLVVGDPDAPGGRTVRRYDPAGVWAAPHRGDPVEAPPLPPPPADWRRRRPATDDVDALLAAALRAGQKTVAPESATRIRGDRLANRTVDVLEATTSYGRLRYWIDRAGQLRRLELRTRLGTWAQLDLIPGGTPALPPVAARGATTSRDTR